MYFHCHCHCMQMTRLLKLRPQKKSWFSSTPSSNFYNKKKKSHALRQILSLGKHVKCIHFSDMLFSLVLIIFQFFSDENQDIYFSISKNVLKKLLTLKHFASKLRGPGFKSRPGTVGGPVTIMWGARPGWKLVLS